MNETGVILVLLFLAGMGVTSRNKMAIAIGAVCLAAAVAVM